MPNASSVDAIRHLREDARRTEVVLVTMNDSPMLAAQALEAGAIGFVLKDTADIRNCLTPLGAPPAVMSTSARALIWIVREPPRSGVRWCGNVESWYP